MAVSLISISSDSHSLACNDTSCNSDIVIYDLANKVSESYDMPFRQMEPRIMRGDSTGGLGTETHIIAFTSQIDNAFASFYSKAMVAFAYFGAPTSIGPVFEMPAVLSPNGGIRQKVPAVNGMQIVFQELGLLNNVSTEMVRHVDVTLFDCNSPSGSFVADGVLQPGDTQVPVVPAAAGKTVYICLFKPSGIAADVKFNLAIAPKMPGPNDPGVGLFSIFPYMPSHGEGNWGGSYSTWNWNSIITRGSSISTTMTVAWTKYTPGDYISYNVYVK